MASSTKPLPKNVHSLTGNPSKKSLNAQIDSVNPEVEIPGCPSFLMTEAKSEWKRIGVELMELRLIAKIDRAALALYCQAWARWVWSEKQLRDAVKRVAKKREKWEADPANEGQEWEGGDGYVVPTKNGLPTYSHHWVIANKAMDQVDKFLQSFGLSPSARARIRPSAQMDLFPAARPDGNEQQPVAENRISRFFTAETRPSH